MSRPDAETPKITHLPARESPHEQDLHSLDCGLAIVAAGRRCPRGVAHALRSRRQRHLPDAQPGRGLPHRRAHGWWSPDSRPAGWNGTGFVSVAPHRNPASRFRGRLKSRNKMASRSSPASNTPIDRLRSGKAGVSPSVMKRSPGRSRREVSAPMTLVELDSPRLVLRDPEVFDAALLDNGGSAWFRMLDATPSAPGRTPPEPPIGNEASRGASPSRPIRPAATSPRASPARPMAAFPKPFTPPPRRRFSNTFPG